MAKRQRLDRRRLRRANFQRVLPRLERRGWQATVAARLEWLERREMLDATAYTASTLVNASPFGAAPFGDVNVGSQLFFFTNSEASPGSGATSLWVTDGTAGRTHDLADNLSLAPSNKQFAFALNGNLLFFAGTSESNGYPELWTSDGTAAGTHELADIQDYFGPQPEGASWVVADANLVGNELYFMLFPSDGYPWGTLWESDGTTAGTMPVPDPAGGPVTVVSGPVTIGDTIYMITRDQTFLSVTDGVPAEQGGWGSDSDNPVIVGQAGNSILYQNFGPGQNQDLGVTDGMPIGPNHNDDDGPPDYFGIYLLTIDATIPAPLNNHGVFIAHDLAGDEMIWATDGTVAGTTMLQSLSGKATFLAPNDQPNQGGRPAQYVVDGKAFFEVSTPTDTQLWVTDGTGATMLEDFTDAPDLDFVGTLGGEYLFVSSLPNDGTATLWASDGAGGGLIQLAKMNSPTLVQSAAVEGGAIVYEMGGSSPYELWQTNGTPSGTLQLPVNNNTFLANIGDYAIFDGNLQNAAPVVFTANGAPNGTFQVTSPAGASSLESAGPPAPVDDEPSAIEDQFLVGGASNGGPVEPWIIAPATSVTATGGLALSGLQGVTLSDQTLATFTDPNGGLAPSSYSADVEWGDGNTSTAAITGPDASGIYTVTGTHVYANDSASPFKLSVVIHRPGSPDAGINDTAQIAASAQALQIADVGIAPGAHLQNQSIAANGAESVYQFQVPRTDSIDVTISGYAPGSPFSLQVTNQSADGGTSLGTVASTSTGATATLLKLSPGTYFAHVSGSAKSFDFSINPDAASTTKIYYVNDDSLTGDVYTTAPGNDANNGLSPATPKATLQSVLDTYTLGPNSLVLIDTGSYTISANIVLTSADSGVSIAGCNDATDPTDPTRNTVIDGGNSAQEVFELDGAQNVTLGHLSITGGVDGIHADDDSGSAGLTVSNSSVYDNTADGIYVGVGNDDPTIVGNTVNGNPADGMYIGSDGASISGNTSFDNGNDIHVGGQNETVEGNQVYAGTFGIFVEYSAGGLNVVRDNTVHDFVAVGIYLRNGSGNPADNHLLVEDNTVYRSGRYGGYSFATNILGAGIAVDCSTVVEQNVVFDNILGIAAASFSQVIDNRVFNNSQIGILSTGGESSYQGNVIYSNGIGVWMNGLDTVANNLIYANTAQGVLVTGPSNNQITNNTIYQPVGDAVGIQNGATDVTLENNILEASTGYDINVASGSESGFQSDYNDLETTGSGQVGYWEGKDLTSLADWQSAAGQDLHSISADPGLVNPPGADGILGFSSAADAGSPAQIIDDSSGAGFTESGAWATVTGGYDGEALQSGDSSATAIYTFNVAPGWYEVAATWPATSGDSGTYYTISDVNGIETVTVDQSQAPSDFSTSGAQWKKLGDFYFAGGTITVRLDSASGADIVADAVLVQKLQGDHGADDDFHVQPTSPTIDAGQPQPNGGRSNQGANVDTPVIDGPLAVAGETLAAQSGSALAGTIATFTDPGGSQLLADYSATIDWGDGSSASAATIGGPDASGVFTISGSHLYTAAGTPMATITVHHVGVSPDVIVHDSVTVSGPITYDSAGGGVTVALSEGNLQILTGGNAASSTPLAEVTSVTINGANGVANSFTLDYSGGTFVVPGGITFNGGVLPGTPSNSLTISGGSFDTETFDFSTAHSGSIQLGTNGQVVNYSNMTPLTNTGAAVNAVFKLPDGTVVATLDDGPTPGTVQLVSGNGTFEATTFAAPGGSLTINSGTGSDTVTTTDNLYDSLNAKLTVNGAINTLPVQAAAVGTIAATDGAALSATVATFTDPNGNGALTDYSATIAWGDGTTSAGTVSVANGTYSITGTHVYSATGMLSVTTTIDDDGVLTRVIGSVVVSTSAESFNLVRNVYVIGLGTVSVSAADGVLANDSGTGQLAVTSAVVTGNEGGTFMFNGDGSFTYTPPANFPGFDDAQYTAKDAAGDSTTATVNVLSQTGGIIWKFFEQVLHRDPAPTDLAFFIPQLATNPPGLLATDFFESDELLGQIITGFYEQYLGRAPQGGDLTFWEAKWRQFGGPELIIAQFAQSQEFNSLANSDPKYAQSGAAPAPWITALYERILQRDPRPGIDVSFWEQQLAAGVTEGQVALDFVASKEAFGDDVTGWFNEYLQRAPTSTELTTYVNEMLGGASDRDIEQQITNLPEYSAHPPAAPAGAGAPLPNYVPSTATAAKDALFAKLGGA